MKVLKRILKYFSWLLIFIVILLIAVYFFIQTDTFNKWALEFTIGKLNKSLELKDNKVDAESLDGNILKGIKLNNGSVIIKGDTLVKFSYLEVKYNLWALLDHRISVEYVDLSYPRVNLIGIKSKDGLIWNFTNLFNKSTTPDTLTSKFDWDVMVNNFKIDNGFIRIAAREPSDSVPFYKMQRQKLNQFDFNNLDITDLNLEMSGKYYKDSKNLSLVNLSFNTNSDFNLKKFAVNADVNHKDTTSDINYLEIITDRSNIKVDKIHLSSFDPLDSISYNNFAAKDFNAKININNFNFADLRFFIPTIDMLDSTVQVYLDTRGKYGDMNVNSLTVKLPNSNIHLKGNIKHLDNPDSMYFDVTADELKIFPPDIKTVLKINSIPDYSNLGMVEGNLYYKGRLDNFYSEYDLKTGAGYINGVTTLDLNHETYNGNITTHSLNLGKILKNNKLNSNINLAAKFDGMGFALNKMNSNITYSMNNSSIMGYNISSSSGEIKSSNNNLNLNIKANTSAGNAAISGRVNIANMKNPVYAVKGNVKGLDVSKFTKNAGDKSNLNVAFDINGRGAGLNNINGKYNFLIDNSTYSQYRIPQMPLNISIVNSNSNGSINIVTDMAEINANGSFDLGTIASAVQYNISSFSNLMNRKLNPNSVAPVTSVPANLNGKNVSLNYQLVLKDTAKLSRIIEPFGMNFNGSLKGSINNSPSGFNSTVLLDVKDFKYQDTAIVLKNVKTDLSFSNNYSSNDGSFTPYSITLNTTGDKIGFGSNRFDSAKVALNLANSIAGIRASGKQDSSVSGRILGSFDLTEDNKITANIDSLYARSNMREVRNVDKWVIDYIPGQEINTEKLAVKTGGLVLHVNGNYSLVSNSDLTVKGDSTPIDSLLALINPLDPNAHKKPSPYEGAITKLLVNYKGTIENPEITAEFSTNTLTYGGNNVGSLNAKINYVNDILTPDIVLKNDSSSGFLKISGNVPYENPLMPPDSSVKTELTGPVGLTVTAQNFEIGGFAKFIPGIKDITGVLKGEITANGTASNPDLKGKLSIDDGTYLLPLTGMDYGFNFNISTANSKLVIDNLTLYNQDDDSRHFDIKGNVDFTGLKLNNIDLTASGDMVFLDKGAVNNDLGVYGYLWGGSGNPPITVKGNLQKLDVGGQFVIKDATITSIPTNRGGYDAENDNFTYILASDSAKHIRDSSIVITPEELVNINPFEKNKYTLSEKAVTTFDFLNLDMNIKTEKNMFVSVDFKNLTQDRLFGELQADLNLRTENKQLDAYGNIDIVGDSYYRFYRDFKINDSHITFNGPISKPILDIKAVYEGTGTKSTQQLGVNSTLPVEVQLTVKGEADTAQVQLNLVENGTIIEGSDAQTDAVTYLLFGKFKSDLNASERQAVASSLGTQLASLYASSYLSQEIRNILPFIVDAEFNYYGGDVQNTNAALTSQFGEATVKVGSRQVNSANYLEFQVDYPLNKVLNLNLPQTLLLEIAKEELISNIIGDSEVHYSTGLKLLYKIKF